MDTGKKTRFQEVIASTSSPSNAVPIVPYPSPLVHRKEVQVQFGPGMLGFEFGTSTSQLYTVCIGKFLSLPASNKPSAAQLYNASVDTENKKLICGMLLTHVNARDVRYMKFVDVMELYVKRLIASVD